jgi:hypothetical protein
MTRVPDEAVWCDPDQPAFDTVSSDHWLPRRPLAGSSRSVVATVLPYWLPVRGRKPVAGLVTYFMHGVYLYVWNEAWAYCVEGSPL